MPPPVARLPPPAACHLPPAPSLTPASALQDIAPFEEPKIELEQYPTGPHLASRLLYTVRWRAERSPPHARSALTAGAPGVVPPLPCGWLAGSRLT